MLRTATIVVLLALAGGKSIAQQMYRCGNSYGEHPCPGGTVLQAVRQPSAADAQQALAVAAQDARRADAMEKARLAQEARAPQAIIIGSDAPVAQGKSEAPGAGKPRKDKKPSHFTATSPPPADAGKKPARKKKT